MRYLLIFIIAVLVCFQSSASESYRVNAPKGLNVRAYPDQKSQVLGLLENGYQVEVVEIQGDWAKINYRGKISYISKNYIEPIDTMSTSESDISGRAHGSAWLPISILVLSILSCYLMAQDYPWIGVGLTILNLCLIWYQLGATTWPLWFVTERAVGTGWMLFNMLLLFISIFLIWTSITVTLQMFEIDQVSIWITKGLFLLKVFAPGSSLMVLLILWTLGYALYRSIRLSNFLILGLSVVGTIIIAIIVNGGGVICSNTFHGFDAFILLAGVFPTVLQWIGEFGSSSSSSSEGLKQYNVDYNGRSYTLTQNSKYSECNYTDENGKSWERDSGGFHPKW